MAERMTAEQVAELPLPDGWTLEEETNGWQAVDSELRGYYVGAALAGLAGDVADGYFPAHFLDWGWRAYKGGDVPTVAQWEAARELAKLQRIGKPVLPSILRDLCDLISPPKPPPLPKIEPCPYCGGECQSESGCGHPGGDWYVVCQDGDCTWRGPSAHTSQQAIYSHNSIARKLRPEPRVCRTCDHDSKSYNEQPCLKCKGGVEGVYDKWEPKT